ncbi:MAG: helix-turn-helix domain-containing protein [Clostridia bacterium]|nr:helix-turn-helix domain-containing protein [Clostridia bacterium]
MEYITTKEAAKKWGLTERRVQVLCRQGKIPGVFRLGWAWAIPKNSEKPKDGRRQNIE